MVPLTTLFKALSDESRLRILNLLLAWGELCVCDIEAVMGFTQTKVSRHLAYLRRARLVAYRRQGFWKLYSLAQPENEGHAKVLDTLALLLRSHPAANKDAHRLASRIARGCCTTHNVVKQEFEPGILNQSHQGETITWTPRQ